VKTATLMQCMGVPPDVDDDVATGGVAWSVCLSVCVCVRQSRSRAMQNGSSSVQPIEMPFGGLTPMGSRNHVLL